MGLYGLAPRPVVAISPQDTFLGVGTELRAYGPSSTSQPWPAANRALLMPIYLPQGYTAVRIRVANGGTANGNVDVGVYDAAFNRIVSDGGHAQSGTTAMQEFDIADTYLHGGQLFVGMACSSGTGTFIAHAPTTWLMRAIGMVQMASAYPLPATITPAACADAYMPVISVLCR